MNTDYIPHPLEGELKFLLALAMIAFGLSVSGLAIILIRWLL